MDEIVEVLSIIKLYRKKLEEKKQQLRKKLEQIITGTMPREALEEVTERAISSLKKVIVRKPILEVKRGLVITRKTYLLELFGNGQIFDCYVRTDSKDFGFSVIVDGKKAWSYSTLDEAIAVSPSDVRLKAYEVYKIGGYLAGVENISFKKNFAFVIEPNRPIYVYEFKCIGWVEYERTEPQ